MNQDFTVFSGFFLATTLISFFVALLAWQRRSVKSAKELSLLMIATGIAAFFLIFETGATTTAQKIFWAKLEYIGGGTTPVLYLIFVLRFTGYDKFLSRKNILFLFILPVVAWLLAMTNESHNLFWTGFSAISEDTNLMEYFHGVGFWSVYLVYSYILLVLATLCLFTFIARSTKPLRAKGWIIFIGCLCPWMASVVYLTRTNPVPGLDLVPVSIVLSGILMTYAILYFRFLDLVPIARETLVETMEDGILVLDEDSRIQDINESALTFLGITNSDIIGLKAISSGASAHWLLDAVINQPSGNAIEINSHDDARTFRILKRAINKKTGSYLVVIQDITEQVARQNAIKSAEVRYRSMFTMFRLMADNMPDMLWAKDLDNKYVFANKAMCENLLHATDSEEVVGKTDLFFAQRERQAFPEREDWHTFGELCRDSDSVVVKSGKPEHFDEFGNVRGIFLFLDVWKAPILDENGNMIGVVGSGRDVTLQKNTEAEIYRRDLLLDAATKATALLVKSENLDETINVALAIVGKAADVNRVYIFQNHESAGYKLPLMSQRYEWTDDSVDSRIDNPDLQNVPYEAIDPRMYQALSTGQVIAGNVCDFPEPEKAGLESQGIKSILMTPVFLDHVFWGYMGFNDCKKERDWTPTEEQILSAAANTIGSAFLRKRNHDELIAAKEKAEESDRLKSAFLANMSHEIRTPMNGILGFAELLKEPDLTAEQQEKYISIIEKSGIRLLNMINDLVDISKIESGQMEIVISKININEQIEYVHNFFRPEVDFKGIHLSISTGLNDQDAIIKTDREKVYAILINLVKNAIKFTNRGNIELGYVKSGKYLEFFVKDTGIGIALDHQQAIFNRFVQANIRNQQVRQGAGLGLSIAKAYVEMLGGTIRLVSEEGKGSVFYFTLPYHL